MEFRDEFSLPKDLIYLNSGTMAFTPKVVQGAIAGYKQVAESNPANSLFAAWGQMWDTQKSLAKLLGARPQDLYLRANVTYAMNDFLMALELPAGSDILISDIEYGAIVHICQYKAELEGHHIKVMNVPIRGRIASEMTDDIFLEQFERSLTPKTSLVMFSHVATASGFVFPIEKIAEVCRRRQIIFAVDGAHGAGAVPVNYATTQVDFYGSNLHKWMMGPKGTGFGWIAPQIRERLKPRFAGWTTGEVPPHFAVFGDGDTFTSRWMICSTQNFSDYYGIKDIVDFWTKHGAEKIMSRQRALRDFTVKTVCKTTGWECLSHPAEKYRGPMSAFELPKEASAKGFELMMHLKERGVQVAMTQIHGTWVMRLAPHIYNTEKEIETAAGLLAEL